MVYAYMGKILWVDLTSGRIQEEKTDASPYSQYIGGTGLAARISIDNIPPKADPLGPDNIIGFVSGLLTGTGSLFTGRWMVAAKSPLTGTWGVGGYQLRGNFSPAIQRVRQLRIKIQNELRTGFFDMPPNPNFKEHLQYAIAKT